MNDLNLISILYISFRLAPFITVSFFSLSSLFNQDLKGLIYLVGLLLATFIAIIFGNSFSIFERPSLMEDGLYQNVSHVCNLMTLSKSGPMSNLPLSQIVFEYTFGYLFYVIFKYNLIMQNIPVLIIFPVLIITDWFWHASNSCASYLPLFVSTILGGALGVGWAYVIDSTGATKLQYYNLLSSKESCSVPSQQSFSCKIVGAAQTAGTAITGFGNDANLAVTGAVGSAGGVITGSAGGAITGSVSAVGGAIP